ncbi:unnamed protein product [Moneuplotes crassus]|uniref:Tetratricopeptide repeat protein n=1 Tax=Euplotes crassus TaxID=5936 RepID=A0AAD1XRR4_EUPCR|nr:unnamed protein product [Moneuplotes crassus]
MEKDIENKETPAPEVEDTATQPDETKENKEEEPAKTPEESQEEAKQEMIKAQNDKIRGFIEKAQELKALGNEFFKEGNFAKAKSKYAFVFSYTKSITGGMSGDDQMLNLAMKAKQQEISEEYKIAAKELERDVNNNMAMIFLKEGNWTKVIEKTTNSINAEKNMKAYFRRGKAYAMKNDFENAYKDFEEGKKVSPDDAKLFDTEIEKTKKREKKYDQQAAKKFSGFFDKKE